MYINEAENVNYIQLKQAVTPSIRKPKSRQISTLYSTDIKPASTDHYYLPSQTFKGKKIKAKEPHRAVSPGHVML